MVCYNVAFHDTQVEQLNQLYILKVKCFMRVSVLWILEESHFSALASSGYRKTHSCMLKACSHKDTSMIGVFQ